MDDDFSKIYGATRIYEFNSRTIIDIDREIRIVKLLNARKIPFNFERLSAMDEKNLLQYQNESKYFPITIFIAFFLLFEKDKSDDTIILNSFRFVKYYFFFFFKRISEFLIVETF